MKSVISGSGIDEKHRFRESGDGAQIIL